jgi:hypothetical protein
MHPAPKASPCHPRVGALATAGATARSRKEVSWLPTGATGAPRTRFLPDNIYDALRLFKGSRFMQELMGEEVHAKFAELKLAQAERCPKALGTHIKASEVQFHHEVTNQFLWSQF